MKTHKPTTNSKTFNTQLNVLMFSKGDFIRAFRILLNGDDK